MRPTTSDIRARLEARRQALLTRYNDALDRAEAELAGDSTELVDIANDRWDARLLTIMSEHDALALENIVAALHRLDSCGYGVCQSCGRAISEARLRILPEVRRCMECAMYEEIDPAPRSYRHGIEEPAC